MANKNTATPRPLVRTARPSLCSPQSPKTGAAGASLGRYYGQILPNSIKIIYGRGASQIFFDFFL